MVHLYGLVSAPTQKSNKEEKQIGRVETIHLWEGTWLKENQNEFIYKFCIIKCSKYIVHKSACFKVCLDF